MKLSAWLAAPARNAPTSQQEGRPAPLELLEHTLVAVAIQAIVGIATRKWWTGAALASGYFIGREIAQAEYRWIENFGEGLRANLPWWGAADPRVWERPDQIADWLGPVIVTVAIALIIEARKR